MDGGGRRGREGGKPCSAQEQKFVELKLGGEKLGLYFSLLPSPDFPPRFFEAERRATAPGHCRSKEKKGLRKIKNRLRKSQRRPLPPTHSPNCAERSRAKGRSGGGDTHAPCHPSAPGGEAESSSFLPPSLAAQPRFQAQPGKSVFSLSPTAPHTHTFPFPSSKGMALKWLFLLFCAFFCV